MKCPKCGTDATGKFCPNCGAPLGEQSIGQTDAVPPGKKKKPIYKRVWFWILAVLVVLSVAIGSCNKKTQSSEASEPMQTGAQADEANPATEAPDSAASTDNTATAKTNTDATADITVDEQVVFDQDGIRITIKELDTEDSFFGPALKVLVENGSSENITVQVRNVSINDIVVESTFSCDVASGKMANDEIMFMSSSLEAANVEIIKNFEFCFHIFDSESWETIIDSQPIIVETSADPAYIQDVDDSGTVVLDQDGIKLVVKNLDVTGSYWGADLYVYVENNSQNDITIQTRDVSVNGFMVDPIFSCDVPMGKKAFDSISFMQSDLEDNAITDITTLELSFHVFDSNNWNTILDTEATVIEF